MIERLPHWSLSNIYPAFQDIESKTAVEMVARLYAKMQELVDNYNKYVDEINKEIENFETGITSDYECFKANINKIMHDYIAMIDEKVKSQDSVIADAVEYMKDNLANTIKELNENNELDEMILNSLSNVENELQARQSLYENEMDLKQRTYEQNVDAKVSSLTGGTPIAVSSIEEMSDTTKLYVNTTDGHWYYYNNEWLDGGVYQATEIPDKSVTSEKTDFIEKEFVIKNVFDKTKIDNTGFYDSTGNFVVASDEQNYGTTQPLEIDPKFGIKIENPSGVITYWDKNLNFVASTPETELRPLFANIKYIRMAVPNDATQETLDTIRIYALSPEKYVFNNLKDSLEATSEVINYNNALDRFKLNTDFYINKDSIMPIYFSQAWGDYGCYIIPIDFPQNIEISNLYGTQFTLRKDLTKVRELEEGEITLQSDEKYIVLNVSLNSETLQPNYNPYLKMGVYKRTIKGLIMDVNNIYYQNKNLNTVLGNIDNFISKLTNKKWDALGDSITEGPNYLNYNAYPYYIGTKYDMDYINRGVSSAYLSQNNENSVIEKVKSCRANADIITVFAGTNDHSGNVQLGTFESRENTTFYGALHYICNYLITNYPSAIKMFMTPIKKYETNNPVNNNGNTLEEFANAIIEVCNYYGIPVIDLFHECQLTPSIEVIKNTYMPDYLHPNNIAHQKFIVPLIENGMEKLF